MLEDEALRIVALELLYNHGSRQGVHEGTTYLDIARKHGLSVDVVKKKLKILFKHNLVLCRGVSPKYWAFNHYDYERMDFTEPIMQLISRYDDDDYEKFSNMN